MSWCPGSPNRNTFFFPTRACVVRIKSDKNHSGKGEKPLSTSYLSLFFPGRVGGKVKFSPFWKLESLFFVSLSQKWSLGLLLGSWYPNPFFLSSLDCLFFVRIEIRSQNHQGFFYKNVPILCTAFFSSTRDEKRLEMFTKVVGLSICYFFPAVQFRHLWLRSQRRGIQLAHPSHPQTAG